MTTPCWTPQQLGAAIQRGPHKSCLEHHDFLDEEMYQMTEKGQWMVLPYDEVKHLPNLRLSPPGVVPQHDRRPRTIVDYTFSFVNGKTLGLAPKEAMQFGRALQRILWKLVQCDRRHGPVRLIKVDIADGFYRIHVHPEDVPTLGVVFPSAPDGTKLVAFPLTLPMGWVESPPWFCVATETGADITNTWLQDGHTSGPHRLDALADTEPDLQNLEIPYAAHKVRPLAIPPPPEPPLGPRKKPLAYVNVYVDDYLALAQGSKRKLAQVRRTLFEAVDTIFWPLSPTDPAAHQEPISVKTLGKGHACWATRKIILGWILDTIILQDLPRTKTRITTKAWHKVLGELRSMTDPGCSRPAPFIQSHARSTPA